ncbi:3-sulfolactaldehyde dehydrogenase [Diabrotica virgifera virgifera]|uniref:Succinate-semialdehyde dehydrogenase n=1 Tax=Diabrotica virgifera virgifera TaxID=50390 RepID=A0ABM5ILA3_DIAVI|nr:3-sulfolactaldehyde dehydrogenase [Diabrotica virgifera virgifera]
MLFQRVKVRDIVRFHLISRQMHLSGKTYINGEWVSAVSNKTFEVINPVDGSVIDRVPDMDVVDAQQAIEAASNAFQSWKNTTAKERSSLLRNWYNLLVKNQDRLAKIMTAESGKPLAEALGEVNYGNAFVEWFSEQARNVRGEIIGSSNPSKKFLIEHYPIGVAALITPWNFPHAMITRKASPALAVGCTVVIKPAEDTPLTALALAQLAEEAGMPKGVINVITSNRQNAPAIGKLLCQSPLVAGISFTGSTQVGKILYQQCASGVKRVGLELGGNAPFIVYNSANVDKAVEGAMMSKFRNCGQACVASNRFLIQDEIYDRFISKLVEQTKNLKVGNGVDCGINIGPLINQTHFLKVSELVNDAISKGATVLAGGKPAPNLGNLFFEPTVLTDVNDKMKVYHEEIFGPVISIVKFKTEEESLKIANNSERGLAAYFFSEDVNQIFRVNKNLEAGMVGINDGLLSAVEAPFGGIKESGIGREGSHHGTEDYTYLKYTCIGNLQ